jgi:hypothetical protein
VTTAITRTHINRTQETTMNANILTVRIGSHGTFSASTDAVNDVLLLWQYRSLAALQAYLTDDLFGNDYGDCSRLECAIILCDAYESNRDVAGLREVALGASRFEAETEVDEPFLVDSPADARSL